LDKNFRNSGLWFFDVSLKFGKGSVVKKQKKDRIRIYPAIVPFLQYKHGSRCNPRSAHQQPQQPFMQGIMAASAPPPNVSSGWVDSQQRYVATNDGDVVFFRETIILLARYRPFFFCCPTRTEFFGRIVCFYVDGRLRMAPKFRHHAL
jgi:hypothetical protein